MSKNLLVLIILIVVISVLGVEVTPEEAYQVTLNHLIGSRQFAREDIGIASWDEEFNFSIRSLKPLYSNNSTLIGYISELYPTGYIALSSDRDIRPIIAYSFTDDFRWDNAPDNLLYHVLRRDLELRKSAIPFTDRKIIVENNQLWKKYIDGKQAFLRTIETTETIGPWLDSNWDQGPPYNNYCPIDPGTGERSVVGCVATAMGMIVDYWEWPPSVTFNSSDSYYSEGTTPAIWIDAATANIDTIDYNSAGNQPDSDTKAKISYACGVACGMHYSSDGSSSDTREVPDALLEKFDYDSADGVTIMSGSFYDILLENIEMAKPVELGIWGMGAGGHAIVADGWKSTDEYHLNMGWGGYQNGWYFLPEGMPEGFNIIGHQACDIKPPVITRRPPYGLSGRATTDLTIELSWEEPMYITEDVLHYNIYRKTTSTDFELVGNSSTLEYTDTDVEEVTYYNYAVTAVYDAGESSSTNFAIYSGIDGGWARTWGSDGEDIARDVGRTPDLGCIAVGQVKYSIYHDTDILIIRTVPGGSSMWSAVLGGPGEDLAYSVILDSDSNYVVVGETEDTVTADYDIWLLKLNDEGDTLWTATYGTPNHDAGLSVIETPTGDYLIAGYFGSLGEEQAYFVKTDSNGELIWSRSYSNMTVAKAVCNVDAGGYIATGYTEDGPHGRDDFYMIRLSDAGDSLWASNSGGDFDDVGNSIIETPDGGFLIAGDSYSYGIPVFSGIHLRRVNSSGDSVWAANYTAMSDYTANSVASLEGGGYLVAGSAEISSNIDFFILALSETGDSLWARLYGTLGTDIAYSAVQLADTGVVAAGVTFNEGSDDFWLMKFGGDVTTHVSNNTPQIPVKHELWSYPNPFNSALSIKTSPNAEIAIYDMSGHLIGRVNANSIGNAVWRPSPDVSSGLYLISVDVDGRSISRRIAYIR